MSEPPMPASNADMIRYWNETMAAIWVDLEDALDAQLGTLGHEAMDALGLTAGERALDVGCGCGATSLELAARVGAQGSVLGVDVAAPMLARARARTAHLPWVRFLHADAQTHGFDPASFDAIYSRFGVMFFADPIAAFANLRAAGRAGARLGFVCWQSLACNEWALLPLLAAGAHVQLPPPPPPGMPGPFAFADRDRLQATLASAGWTQIAIEALERPLVVGGTTDLDAAVELMLRIGPTGAVLRENAAAPLHVVRTALRETFAGRCGPHGVELGSASWVVTARAP